MLFRCRLSAFASLREITNERIFPLFFFAVLHSRRRRRSCFALHGKNDNTLARPSISFLIPTFRRALHHLACNLNHHTYPMPCPSRSLVYVDSIHPKGELDAVNTKRKRANTKTLYSLSLNLQPCSDDVTMIEHENFMKISHSCVILPPLGFSEWHARVGREKELSSSSSRN